MITLFLDILGIGLIIPILPRLIEEFCGGSVTQASHIYGVLAALYSLMQFLFAPMLGSLSDRFGRRPVILSSLLGSGLDYLLLAWAPSLAWFFVGRVIAGITGASITAASAYIADVSPPEKRAQSYGLIGAAFGLGFIAGPALGGLLGHVGLRVPFLVAAGLTLLNWLYGVFVLPESLKRENRRAFSWGRSNPVGSLLALRRYPVVLGLTATYFLLSLAHAVMPSTWVLYTSYRYNWSVAQTGVSLAVFGLLAAVVQGGLVRVVIAWLGEPRALMTGMAAVVMAMTGYGLATEGWMIYLVQVVGALGGFGGPAAQSMVSKSVGVDEQGAVQGSLSSLASVAGVLGAPLATSVFGYFIGPNAPWHLPGAAFFVGAALVVVAMGVTWRVFKRNVVSQSAEP